VDARPGRVRVRRYRPRSRALTVNPNEVDILGLCGRRFEIPIIAAAMDGVVGGRGLAIEMGVWAASPSSTSRHLLPYANPDEVSTASCPPARKRRRKIIQSDLRRADPRKS